MLDASERARLREESVPGAYIILAFEVIAERGMVRSARDHAEYLKGYFEEYGFDGGDVSFERSEYESGWRVFAWQANTLLTPEQYRAFRDGMYLDDDDDGENTLGSITEYGHLPARSYPGIFEGHDSMGFPADRMTIGSCYVSEFTPE